MDPEELVGKTFGPVVIERFVGHEESGPVYAGHNPATKTSVLVRLIGPDLARRYGFKEKWLFEARLSQLASHPNLLRVLEAGEHEGRLYAVTEYFRGEALESLVEREGALPSDRATRLARDIARGLQAAHELDLIHRDIRPANILVAEDGQPKLANFGLSQTASAVTGPAPTESWRPRPQCLAPEQVEGAAGDARADLYALGVTYYYMLAGRYPFSGGSDGEIARARVKGDPPAIPDLPSAFRPVLDRLLARRPQDRFASAADAVTAFEKSLYGRDVKAHPGETTRIPPPATRAAPGPASRRGGILKRLWSPARRLPMACLFFACAAAAAVACGAFPAASRGLVIATGACYALAAVFVLRIRVRPRTLLALLLGAAALVLAWKAASTAESWRALASRLNALALAATFVLGVWASTVIGYDRALTRRFFIVAALALAWFGAKEQVDLVGWAMSKPLAVLPVVPGVALAVFCALFILPHPGAGPGARILGAAAAFAALAGVAYLACGGNTAPLVSNLETRALREGTAGAGALLAALWAYFLARSL